MQSKEKALTMKKIKQIVLRLYFVFVLKIYGIS